MSETVIHPSAIIEEGAVIGEGCQIGPFCLVRSNVKLGKNNILHAHVVIDGPSEIGDENEFFQFCSIGAKTQDLKYSGEPTYLRVGDRNTFRESFTVHRGTSPGEWTEIGDDCSFLAYTHVAHNCLVGNRVVMSNYAALAGHVEVGNHVIVAGLTAAHQFTKIGDYAMIGAHSFLTQDAMPYCISQGNHAETRVVNKIGLERAGLSKEAIRSINKAFKIIFRSNLSIEESIAELEKQFPDSVEVKNMIEFMKNSQRGLARPKGK
jgi:UDP-N-acetylglucosamine acyltransferase